MHTSKQQSSGKPTYYLLPTTYYLLLTTYYLLLTRVTMHTSKQQSSGKPSPTPSPRFTALSASHSSAVITARARARY